MEKSSRVLPLFSGIFIAAGLFALLFTAIAWFMPRFLELTNSRWAHLLLPVAVLLVLAGCVIRVRRARPTRK